MQFLSDASFWAPHSLPPSALVAHTPFLFWLSDVLRPRAILALAPDHQSAPMPFEYAVRILELGTRIFSFAALPHPSFDHIQDASIDLLYVDLSSLISPDHAAASLLLEQCAKKCSKAAILLLHGINQHPAWHAFGGNHPYITFPHELGLSAIGLGSALPLQMNDLFDSAQHPGLRQRTQTVYRVLGTGLMATLMHKPVDYPGPTREQGSSQTSAALQKSLWEAQAQICTLEGQLITLESDETRKRTSLLNNLTAQVQEIRAELEQPHLSEIARLQGISEALAADLALYKSEYFKAVNSRSWQLTRPLRGEGTLFDLFKNAPGAK